MTGSQLYTLLTELVGDSPSDTWFYATVNACKDTLESTRKWAYLRKVDATQVRSAGDTYLTAKVLPSDFGTPNRLTVGTDRAEYALVPFDRLDYKDTDGTWRIDIAGQSFHFNGTAGTTGTAYLSYQRFTPALTSATSPVFPERFHALLAYDAAKRWYAKDQSERSLAWNTENEAEYRALLSAMERWDEQIKASESNQGQTNENALDLT